MEEYTLDNGVRAKNGERENNTLKTVLFMRDIGRMIHLVEKEE